jgi:Protein of unknown function (DUF3828)
MPLRRRQVLALALSALATPFALTRADARSEADPADTLRALYGRGTGTPTTRFQSARLRRLYAEQQRRSRERNEILSGLDFDFSCDCQDYQRAKLLASLAITPVSRSARAASLDVRVDNGSGPFALTYMMVFENGRWLIDDVRKTSGETYLLSDLLQTLP